MYLSRLNLDLAHPVVARAVGDLHAQHRLVLQGFPETDQGGPGRVLYRLETDGLPTALIQSEKEPHWNSLRALTSAIDGPKPFDPQFSPGQTLRFRLRATPTKKTQFGEDAARPGHRRVGFFTETEQRAWLERKGREGGGFALVEVRTSALGWQEGRKPGGGILRHHAVQFDGVLRVTDAGAFRAALACGIGPAKGFGFGLLSVAHLA